MRIALIYFSPTENTAKIAEVIKKEMKKLKVDMDKYDITSYSDRQNVSVDINLYDALIFGFPIYAWRAPQLIRDWLKTIDGKEKKCSVFFTYGGVSPGVAHYDIKQILEQQNFQVVSTAEFLGKHTYNLGGMEFNGR